MNENKKTFKDPIIDDSEEYFVIYKIINQETPNTTASLNDRANIIPKYTAMPFPPLNLNQIGNICPRKLINPDK